MVSGLFNRGINGWSRTQSSPREVDRLLLLLSPRGLPLKLGVTTMLESTDSSSSTNEGIEVVETEVSPRVVSLSQLLLSKSSPSGGESRRSQACGLEEDTDVPVHRLSVCLGIFRLMDVDRCPRMKFFSWSTEVIAKYAAADGFMEFASWSAGK